MGLLSLMPSEMPLTIVNTKTSTMAKAMKNTGWCSTLAPTQTTIAPQNTTQATRRPTWVRCQSGCFGTTSRNSGGERQRRQACTRICPMSRMAAPMIRPRPMRKVILRKGSPGCSQPMDTNSGISRVPVRPATNAATPMRAPTSKPAPRVEVDSSIAPSQASLAEPSPPSRPRPMPVPRRETERLSSTGSVSARRMLATARPDGKVSCSRSTRMGV
jgi:hypothetical protein